MDKRSRALASAYRVEAIEKGLDVKVRKINREIYQRKIKGESFEDIEREYETLMRESPLLLHYAEEVNVLHKGKTLRLRKRIKSMCESAEHVLFLTFNFNDEALSDYSSEERRIAVSRFLKTYCFEYVGNIDFGSNAEYVDRNGRVRVGSEREHYHAIGVLKQKIDLLSFGLGFVYYEEVKRTKKDLTRLAKYINKLCYHAMKDTATSKRLIYSRKCLSKSKNNALAPVW